MKKFIINLSLVGLGVVATIGYTHFCPCSADQSATCADSTSVDTVKVVPVVLAPDTAKKDTVK